MGGGGSELGHQAMAYTDPGTPPNALKNLANTGHHENTRRQQCSLLNRTSTDKGWVGLSLWLLARVACTPRSRMIAPIFIRLGEVLGFLPAHRTTNKNARIQTRFHNPEARTIYDPPCSSPIYREICQPGSQNSFGHVLPPSPLPTGPKSLPSGLAQSPVVTANPRWLFKAKVIRIK